MDSYLQSQILAALIDRDWSKVVGYLLIFVFIWLQIRDLKKSLNALNKTIGDSFKVSDTKFASGELRFEAHERIHIQFEHRLTLLENNPKESYQ